MEKEFQDAEDIENNMIAELKAVPMETFADHLKNKIF
jgi:hypothetical protein